MVYINEWEKMDIIILLFLSFVHVFSFELTLQQDQVLV